MLVFHYRDPMAMRFDGEPLVRQPPSSLVFQTRRVVEIQRPWGAHHFLGAPLAEFADRTVPAGELWGGGAGELEEQLAAASATRQRIGLVERFLLRQLRCHHKEEIEVLVWAVWSHKGNVRVSRLCRDLGLSERSAQMNSRRTKVSRSES
ncbi:MAG: hypothetical protein GY953_18600 [bacterium]|nr:hypothetical protein [bacterium]